MHRQKCGGSGRFGHSAGAFEMEQDSSDIPKGMKIPTASPFMKPLRALGEPCYVLAQTCPSGLPFFGKCAILSLITAAKERAMFYYNYVMLYIAIFLFGAVIGSFLNVCILRLPRDESIVRVRSHCMTCGKQIENRDLIPILSWILLRGRCRNCGAKISFRYTFVESLNAVAYVLIFAYYGLLANPILAVFTCCLFSALVVVFFMDWDTKLINMYVVGFIGLLGVGRAVYDFVLGNNWPTHIWGGLAVFAPLMLLVLLSHERAMGSGDAWLMLAGGFYLGLKGAVVALFIGLVLGSIVGMIQKIRTGNSLFAFGPWLSVGVFSAVFCGEAVADWYLRVCGF